MVWPRVRGCAGLTCCGTAARGWALLVDSLSWTPPLASSSWASWARPCPCPWGSCRPFSRWRWSCSADRGCAVECAARRPRCLAPHPADPHGHDRGRRSGLSDVSRNFWQRARGCVCVRVRMRVCWGRVWGGGRGSTLAAGASSASVPSALSGRGRVTTLRLYEISRSWRSPVSSVYSKSACDVHARPAAHGEGLACRTARGCGGAEQRRRALAARTGRRGTARKRPAVLRASHVPAPTVGLAYRRPSSGS